MKLSGVIVGLFLIIGASLASADEDVDKCLKCHEATWNNGLTKMYIHEPFQEKQCLECHCEITPDGKKVDLRQQSKQPGSKVQWAGHHLNPSLTHWFKFPVPVAGGDLVFDATLNRKVTQQRRIQLPALTDLPRSDNDHIPPRISGVRVVEVRVVLFYSATIEWETDEAADAKVEYGIKEVNLSSSVDNNFSTRHQVTLVGIEPRKNYQFKVVSGDIHGNRSTSEILSFSTQTPFSSLDEQNSGLKSYPKSFEVNPEFFQSDGDYLVKITATQPVEVGVGILPSTQETTISGKKLDGAATFKHPLTTDAFHVNISLCYKCHQKYVDGPSHPVNVYPKRGMIIPPEYPTLPDGRMTCSTCHEHHASNLKNRTIKQSNKDLCLGCHKDM